MEIITPKTTVAQKTTTSKTIFMSSSGENVGFSFAQTKEDMFTVFWAIFSAIDKAERIPVIYQVLLGRTYTTPNPTNELEVYSQLAQAKLAEMSAEFPDKNIEQDVLYTTGSGLYI